MSYGFAGDWTARSPKVIRVLGVRGTRDYAQVVADRRDFARAQRRSGRRRVLVACETMATGLTGKAATNGRMSTRALSCRGHWSCTMEAERKARADGDRSLRVPMGGES